MKKRGQITLFVIIGIVIVSGVLIGVVYKDKVSDFLGDLEIIKGRVPIEAKSVQDFVTGCIEVVSKEGLDIIGSQGGYYELPGDTIARGSANIFSNKLEYIRGFETAYWFYQKDNEIDVMEIPSIETVEKELGKYVKENLMECVDFSEFEDFGIRYNFNGVDVAIRDEKVSVNAEMDVQGKKGDVEFKFYGFNSVIDSKFGKLHGLGEQMVKMEGAESYFEEKTLEMMSVYDEVPMTGVSFDCAPFLWSAEKVEQDLKRILFYNMMFFKVKGTNYELAKENRKYFEWDITGEDYKDVNTNFLFSENWPFYFEVAPNENGVMRSEQITDVAGEFGNVLKALYCVNNYHFVYDLKYPIMVKLNEDDDVLQFGMMVVVKDNQARKTSVAGAIPEPEVDFCDTKMHNSVVYTYERVDGELVPLEDVNIRYKCITTNCDLGRTIFIDDEAYLSEKFPLCLNGVLTGDREGYNKKEEIVSSNSQFVTSLVLEKLVKMDVDVFVNRENINSQDGKPLENEKVIIELENKDKRHKTIIIYPEMKEIELLEGDYHVKIYVLYEGDEITLKGRTIEKCVDVPKKGVLGFFGGDEKKCFKTEIPDTSLSNFISGESEFDFYVSESDLNNDFVRFYIKQKDIPTSVEDLEESFKTEPVMPVFLDE